MSCTIITPSATKIRESHEALDGFAARNDDAVWGKIYPPCGYNCRCTVTAEGPDGLDTEEADSPGMDRIPAEAEDLPDFAEVAA